MPGFGGGVIVRAERIAPRRVLDVLVACACFAACGSGANEPRGGWAGVIDTLDGVIYVRNPGAPLCAVPPPVERDLVIGGAPGGPAYEFDSVWDVEVDERGDIYVADPGRDEVLVYDSAGRFRQGIGREGDGPGEFRFPARLAWRDGRLAVLDRVHLRLSFFTSGGILLRDTMLQDLPYLSDFALPSPDGLLVQVGPSWMSPPVPGAYGVGRLLSVDLHTPATRDTLVEWSDSAAMAHYGAPGVSLVAEVPFGPRAFWAATHDGRVFFTEGVQYSISEYGRGGILVRKIERAYTLEPVGREERDSVQERIDTYDRRLRDRIRIPAQKPAVRGLRVDDRGRLWVRVSLEAESQGQQWDIFASDGTYRSAVLLPPGIDVKRIRGAHVYAVAKDPLGVARVVRFRYRLSCPSLAAASRQREASQPGNMPARAARGVDRARS